MKVLATELPEVLVLEPRVFRDDRGSFCETWNAQTFRDATGVMVEFVQDNESWSHAGVLRGIHYQVVKPQGKLVRAVAGRVIDVAVDLRRSSPNFGRWVAIELTGDTQRQVWIPPGFGHAFLVLSDGARVSYKTTEYWYAEHDRSLAWNDPDIAIDWTSDVRPILSAKDAAAPRLRAAEVFP